MSDGENRETLIDVHLMLSPARVTELCNLLRTIDRDVTDEQRTRVKRFIDLALEIETQMYQNDSWIGQRLESVKR